MPTASATSAVEITAQLDLWKVGGASALTEPGIINLSAGAYGTMSFNQTMGYPVQIIGPTGLTAGATKITFASGATNIYFEKVSVSGTISTSGSVIASSGSSNCGIRKSKIEGRTEAEILVGTLISGSSYGVLINSGSTGFEVSECYVTGFKLLVYIAGGTGWLVEKNFFRYFGGVIIQCGSVDATGTIQRNFASAYWASSDSASHLDFIFLRGSAGITSDKNVCIRANDIDVGKIFRGIVYGDGGFSTDNASVNQNLLVVNNVDGIRLGEPGESNGTGTMTNNTVLVAIGQTSSAGYYANALSNMTTITRSGNAWSPVTGSGDATADSGGTVWTVGTSYATKDYSAYDTDYATRPALGCNLSKLIPKNTSQLYPGTGTVGSYDLISDLLAGVHPAAWDAAVADPFNLYMNTDGFFTPAGNNTAPVGVDDSGYTTPYGTDLVLSAATLLANDTDADLDTLTITEVGSPVGGTVSLVGTTITFTPTPGFSGAASFVYSVSDGKAADAATVSLTVERPQMLASVATSLAVTVTVG